MLLDTLRGCLGATRGNPGTPQGYRYLEQALKERCEALSRSKWGVTLQLLMPKPIWSSIIFLLATMGTAF